MNEPQLTSRMAEIATGNGVSAEVAKILVGGVQPAGRHSATPCQKVAEALDGERVVLDPRLAYAYRRTVVERIRRRAKSQVEKAAKRELFDWLFLSDRLALVVEVKIKDQPMVQNDQLRRYANTLLRHPTFRDRPVKGLLVLTREKVSDHQLGLPVVPVRKLPIDQVLLGQVLWRDVADDLRQVRLHSRADEMEWNALIDFALGPRSSSSDSGTKTAASG